VQGRPDFTNAVHGWDAGFLVGSGLLFSAALVMFSLVRVSKEQAAAALKEAVPA
jgi:hypothetical protein